MVGFVKERLGRNKINNFTHTQKEIYLLKSKKLNGNYLIFDFNRLVFVYKSKFNDLENDDNN
jgi:hypothetical protein